MEVERIQSIPTYYHGYRFRSRLEARWAMYFDLNGIKWEYEPEGYAMTLKDGNVVRYLPDFKLYNIRYEYLYKGTDYDKHIKEGRDEINALEWGGIKIPELYVEVKGVMTDWDKVKIASFVNAGNKLLILYGIPFIKYQGHLSSLEDENMRNVKLLGLPDKINADEKQCKEIEEFPMMLLGTTIIRPGYYDYIYTGDPHNNESYEVEAMGDMFEMVRHETFTSMKNYEPINYHHYKHTIWSHFKEGEDN